MFSNLHFLYKSRVPTFEYRYVDGAGEVHFFEKNVPYSAFDTVDKMMSPCGNYAATRVPAIPATHQGLTATEKSAGTTTRRRDMAGWTRDQREKRQRSADPGTRARESNELWLGNENLSGVILPKSA